MPASSTPDSASDQGDQRNTSDDSVFMPPPPGATALGRQRIASADQHQQHDGQEGPPNLLHQRRQVARLVVDAGEIESVEQPGHGRVAQAAGPCFRRQPH